MSMKRIVLFVTVLAVAALAMRSQLGAADGSIVLAVPGRANATPSIAARGRVVVVVWSASARGATDIYAAVSRDAGSTFAPPVRVNDAAASASVSGEQPPRVVLTPRPGSLPSIAVIWTAKTSAGTRIVTARSEDGGRTFGASRTLSGSDAPGNRGWESAATDGEGNGVVVWLDHRELAVPGGAAAPMAHDHAAMTKMPAHDAASVGREQLSKLYVQPLDGSGQAVALTGGVCYCCKTNVVAGPDRTFYAVWRHVYAGNIRDIAFTLSRDGGRTFAAPVRVSEDRWALDGCPENGPAVTVAGNDVVVVWPTLVSGPRGSEAMQLFFASTRDGKRFTPRAALPTEGVPRHPQLATLANGTVVAAWDEAANGGRRVVLAVKQAARPAFEGRSVVTDSQTAQYPAIAAVDASAVVAWTSGAVEQSVVRVSRHPLP
jgi:hypothetical protein